MNSEPIQQSCRHPESGYPFVDRETCKGIKGGPQKYRILGRCGAAFL